GPDLDGRYGGQCRRAAGIRVFEIDVVFLAKHQTRDLVASVVARGYGSAKPGVPGAIRFVAGRYSDSKPTPPSSQDLPVLVEQPALGLRQRSNANDGLILWRIDSGNACRGSILRDGVQDRWKRLPLGLERAGGIRRCFKRRADRSASVETFDARFGD